MEIRGMLFECFSSLSLSLKSDYVSLCDFKMTVTYLRNNNENTWLSFLLYNKAQN